MDKENVLNPHSGLLLSHEEERYAETGYNMDEPGGRYAR